MAEMTLLEAASFAPYVVGAPIVGYFGWKLFRFTRRALQIAERMPTRAMGAVMTLAAVTAGPYTAFNLMESNIGAGAGAAGGSLFLLVTGILLLVKGKELPEPVPDPVEKLSKHQNQTRARHLLSDALEAAARGAYSDAGRLVHQARELI